MSFFSSDGASFTPHWLNGQMQYQYTAAATTNNIILNGPVTISQAPPPPPLTEVERLLADVEAVCALGR